MSTKAVPGSLSRMKSTVLRRPENTAGGTGAWQRALGTRRLPKPFVCVLRAPVPAVPAVPATPQGFRGLAFAALPAAFAACERGEHARDTEKAARPCHRHRRQQQPTSPRSHAARRRPGFGTQRLYPTCPIPTTSVVPIDGRCCYTGELHEF